MNGTLRALYPPHTRSDMVLYLRSPFSTPLTDDVFPGRRLFFIFSGVFWRRIEIVPIRFLRQPESKLPAKP